METAGFAPTNNVALSRWSVTESAHDEDLVTDRFAPAVRLEQERIDGNRASAALRDRFG